MNLQTIILRAGAVMLAFAIAGCGGGGGSSPAPVTAKSPGTSSPASTKKYSVSVNFLAKSPSAKTSATARVGHRKSQYVSPATLGATIVATSTDVAANSATFGFDLSTGNTACASTESGISCTLTFLLAADTYTIALTTYDSNQATAPGTGTALSIDTEPETIAAGSSNSITLNPQAYVAGFEFGTANVDEGESVAKSGSPAEMTAAGRAQQRARALAKKHAERFAIGLDDVAVGTAPVFGFMGGFNDDDCCINTDSLDRDYYQIADYPGVANFANGTFVPTVTESGDGTGCTPTNPCSAIEGVFDFGNMTQTFPSYETPAEGAEPPFTITQPTMDQQNFYLHYFGGGGIGTGITSWIVHTFPTGQQPFYSDVAIPNATGGPYGTIAPYVVPHAYLAPLFAYSTDGVGNATTTTGTAGGPIYVWAGQSKIPTGSAADGSSYTVVFEQSGTNVCTDGDGNTVMTVGEMDYAAGYGEVSEVDVTPAEPTTCTLDLSDGFGDTASVTLTAPVGVVIESHARGSAVQPARRKLL